ncbi:hypothetical protein [Lichenifustis flavocetrariae]|uniref:Uncharacterized protein n=1 Tax=Lichenifustis flavocetrariae TaxID=2949735 RepID=A0AA41YU67_9HYPH|nr:hypothetical protein [Lichenifustis flavocetrariae]MCW6508646.1 hypothetical protein [Lichenifustis flavocetrariae]
MGRVWVLVATITASFWLLASAASAQDLLGSLEGYSVIGERQEEIPDEQPPFTQTFHERIYFGRDGRIFSKQTVESGNPHNAGSFAMISGQDYGQQAPFQWTGSGVGRQWTNPTNGVILTMTIDVRRTSKGFSCALDLERQGYAKRIELRRETCRVVRGNAVAD